MFNCNIVTAVSNPHNRNALNYSIYRIYTMIYVYVHYINAVCNM